MAIAIRSSWQTQPLPTQRQHFNFSRSFSAAEISRLKRGHIPEGMDDRWFVVFENGWLYFYRSWTGFCVFGVRLEPITGGVHVTEAWASADTEQYQSPGIKQDERTIEELIDWLLNLEL